MSVIPTQTNKVIYDGDGQTTVFPIPFSIIDKVLGADVQVYIIDDSGDPPKLLTSGYTVNPSAMTVTYPNVGAALAVGWQLALLRVEPLTQGTSLSESGPFSPTAVMAALDKLTAIVQQQQEQINRAVKYPLNSSPTSDDVNAFIAAVGSAIMPPALNGTYAYLKSVSDKNPDTFQWGIATDLGSGNALMVYLGNSAVGDQGWFGPLAGA